MYIRINQNSLAQFMKTRIRPIHISKPIHVVMVPSGPWPGAPLVQKTVLGQGVTYVGGASRIVLRGHGKSVRRAGKKRRRELRGTA